MRRKAVSFTLLCSAVYFMSYFTRYSYAASLTEIVSSRGLSYTAAAAAVTCAFVTYGAGQVLSGMLGDRSSPRHMIPLGLIGTAICNFIMTLPLAPFLLTLTWSVNGLFQSMIWPPLLRSMTEHLDDDSYRTASAIVSAAANAATILLYLVTPLSISVADWRLTFRLASCGAIAIALLWYFVYPRYPAVSLSRPSAREEGHKRGFFAAVRGSGFLLLLLAIFCHGVIKDGVLTWMPTYLKEKCDLGSAASILSTVLLPLLSIVCILLATALVRRFPNEITCALACFIPATLATVVPAFFSSAPVPLTVAAFVLAGGSMHGTNILLTSQAVQRFRDSGRVSTVAGLINAATYVGSAASAYGIAFLSEAFGWGVAPVAWFAFGAAGCLLLAIELPIWMKKFSLTAAGRPQKREM